MSKNENEKKMESVERLGEMRLDYREAVLLEEDAAADPLDQFRVWFDAAHRHEGVREPNAATLATATPQGVVSARIVLIKGLDARGFQFFTNYESRKGGELEVNPQAALVFFWEPLQRQIDIRGRVEKVEAEISDAYYASRPYGSRIGAWASIQSSEIPDREILERRAAEFRERYPEGGEVPRPPHWGGYRLVPEAIEFWQGRPSRLHDRLLYRRESAEGEWERRRLSP